MSNENLVIGNFYEYNSQIGQLASLPRKGGWVGLSIGDRTINARASQLVPHVVEEPTGDESASEYSMSKHIMKYRKRYVKVASKKGAASMSNGDMVAKLLEGMDHEDVAAIADAVVPLPNGECHLDRYGHLNNGQIRMNCGNRIRGAVKREDVDLSEVQDAIEGLAAAA